ncbi:GNAT family N-acetyltransferase [Ferruginivarius sediminum]|nr:N-acetyltransferase [Ferruginivarius sediminum]
MNDVIDTPVTVRRAEPADAATLAAMLAELATSEGKTVPPASEAQLAEWLGGDDPPFHALIAGRGGADLGYLVFYRTFSLFKATPVLLVENIYVRHTARGLGVGRKLLTAAAGEAAARGWRRLELNVRAENDSAAGFYRRLGFTKPGEEVRRLEDEALEALAEAGGDA